MQAKRALVKATECLAFSGRPAYLRQHLASLTDLGQMNRHPMFYLSHHIHCNIILRIWYVTLTRRHLLVLAVHLRSLVLSCSTL